MGYELGYATVSPIEIADRIGVPAPPPTQTPYRAHIPDPVLGWAVLRVLIRVLAHLALDQGSTHFDAVLLRSNRASSRMLDDVGAVVENRIESGTSPGHRPPVTPPAGT